MSSQNRNPDPAPDHEESLAVPLFGTWRRAYLVVVVIFLVELAFFAFVSRYFL